jgi:hypothetical protein
MDCNDESGDNNDYHGDDDDDNGDDDDNSDDDDINNPLTPCSHILYVAVPTGLNGL